MFTLFKSFSASIATSTQTHFFTALLLESISGIQTIYLLLITIFPASENKAFRFTELLKQITSIFATGEILGPGTFGSSALEVICCVFLGYLIVLGLFIILLFIRSYSQPEKTRNNNLASLISKALRFHSRVIFFVAQYYFLKYLTNSSDSDIPSNEITWRWWLIVGYIANILITALQETCFYQRAKIKDSYATHTNIFHQLALAHKLFGLTVYFLASSLAQDKMQTETAVVHIVFTVAARAALSVFLPFYSAKITKASIFFTSLQLSLAIILIMSACGLKREILEALCMIIPPLLAKILLTVLRWRSERILQGKVKYPQDAMHFAVLFKQLAFGPAHPSRHLRNVPKESLVSNGLLSTYQIDITKGVLIESEEEYKQMVYLHILQVLEGVSMKHPNSIALSLYIAKVYLKRLNNESQALKLIMRVQSRNLSLTDSNSLEKFNTLMEQLKHRAIQEPINIFDRHNKGEKEDIDIHKIDIQSYFRAQEFVDLVRKDMYQEVSNHLSFWQALKSDQLDVKTMFDLCQKIESLSIKLRKYYAEDLSHLQNYCCATIIMFAVYLHLIREIPEDSSLTKRFMRYLKDSSLRHALDMYSNDVAVIVNSTQGASGVILSASGSLQSIFQIQGSRLVGKSINYLFPSVFAKQYMDFLYEYTKSLSSTESENKFKTFAKTASGHLFEVEISFKVYPEISQEMKIMALLKALPSSHHVILLGHEGHIIDCDSQIAKDLNIMPSDLGRTNIQKLCATFNLVNKAFNSVYSNEWEVGSRGTKRNQSQGLEIDKREATISLTQKFPTDTLMSPKYPDNHPLISPKSPTETMPMMLMTHPNTETLINFKTIVPTQHDDTFRTEQSERHQSQKAGFDKAKGMCETFMKGKKLTLVEHNRETEDKRDLKETEYDVKIEPHVLDGKVYKLLRLENAQLVKEKPLLSEVAKSVALKLKGQKTFQQLSERRSSQASSIEGPSQKYQRNPIIEIVEKEKKESAAALVTRLQRTLLNSLGYQEGEEPEAPNELEIFPEMLAPEIAINKTGIVRKQQDIIDSSLDPSRASQDNVVLAHKVQQSQISSMHSSMISAKSAKGRTMRALHQVLDDSRSYFVSFRALVVMYLIILGLFGLAIANYSYSLSSINQVQEELNANNLLNVRLCAAMSGWSALVRLLVRSSGWRTDTQQGIQRVQGNVSLYAESMNTDNNNLQRLLASSKTKALFNRMLRRDIIFDLNTTNVTSQVGPMNSFIATDLLVNKYYEAARLSYSEIYTAESSEVIGNAIQNGGNDYLVSSEGIMTETEDMLSSVSSQSVLVLKLILIFVFVALVLFLVAYTVILNSIVLKLQKLFQAIIRIEQHSIDKKILRFEQVKDLFEEDIQTDTFIANASNLLYQRRPRDKKQQEKLLRSSHKNINTRSLVKILAAYLLVAIILIMILCGFFVEGLINTINSFHSMDTINNQLHVLSKAQYQASALSGLLHLDIMYWNSTTTFTFRRKSIKTQMETTLSFFAGVNENIKEAFSYEENDQVIEDLLNYKICGYLTSMTTTRCWAGTLNDTLNIQGINAFFYATSAYYYNLFLTSPTADTGRTIFLVFYRTVINYVNTLDEAYTFLIRHIIDNVNTTVDDFKSMKLVRFIIILVVILACVVVIQNVTVRMFAHYDKGRGSILKIMGMDVVLESKALIYYIKSEFDKKGTILGSNALK